MSLSQKYIIGQPVTLSSISELSVVEPKFNRTGYTFKNMWNYYENGNLSSCSSESNPTFNTDTVDLSAVWEINKYTVTIDNKKPQYGQVTVKVDDQQITSGTEVEYSKSLIIDATSLTGGKFVKIIINGQEFSNSSITFTVPDENVNIEAVFDENSGTLTYNPGY